MKDLPTRDSQNLPQSGPEKQGTYSFLIEAEREPLRLDKFLAESAPDLSRSRLKTLILSGYVQVDGKPCAPSDLLKPGQRIDLTVPEVQDPVPLPQAISLEIIYEDDHLVVVNKPAGMVVHPAPGNRDQTLVNALLAHCGDSLSGISGVRRPGIVHRLDKGTSGLMVVAKNDRAHQALAAQFADRTLSRIYRALVWGVPRPLEGTIEEPIGRSARHRQKMAVVAAGGKPALTHYKVEETFGVLGSLVTCRLQTGRTHQIRVHLTFLGHSLIGDPLYGRYPRGLDLSLKERLERLTNGTTRPALHAENLTFLHPFTEKKVSFQVPLPQDFEEIYKVLKNY